LLAEWLAATGRERSVAWLSLEESDRQPVSYWTYLLTALQAVAPGVGTSALPLLQSAQPPVETILTTVVNELATVPDDVYLVLDDYHLADGPDIQAGMTFLVEHLPPRVHLVVSTRADPALPLARLRAGGELVEVRAADLRFTHDEVAAYLNDVTGLDLGAGDLAALEGRTEGWIAALQLAALSMQGRDDVAGFIAGFAGDDRYIVDYLVEEVLGRQPADVRGFLVLTSVLDRLSGPLCDAVTGQQGGRAMLETLDRANLFLVPLDDSRRWYRDHHLFADVLHTYLVDEDPDQLAALHRRASRWYEQHGEHSQAIRHALAAVDVERAAALVELAIPETRRRRQEATIRGWLEAVPGGVVRVRPVLAVGYIGALMSSGEFEGVEDRLRVAERWLEPTGDRQGALAPPAGMVVVDEGELRRLPAVVEMYRAALALVRGDVPATIGHAQRAIDRAAAEDHLTRAGASASSASHAGVAATSRPPTGPQGTVLRGTADMHVGMSQIACERDDLPTATQHLLRAQDLGEHTWLPQNPYRWRVAMARVREAEGDLDGALDLLDEAQRVYMGDFSPNVRPIPALRARVLAAQGRVGEALAWGREQGLSATDDLSYRREYEHIALARALLAQSRAQPSAPAVSDAAGLLRRLLQAAEAGERTGSAIEVLVLQALTDHARGDVPGALAALERALTLAEPEGYVRVFAGEGPPMASLLRRVARRRSGWGYVRRLLHAAGRAAAAAQVGPAAPARQGLVEPLSERELDVLRLLGSDLDGPDIARELTVSLNTLRTHTKSIYAKLGVNSRRAAVRQAAELNLLSRGRDR
jgi:LuxR family transcriptional regulator, maltose regulon positive regulatory protein